MDILVVCNGCSDNTAQIARAFGEPVRVVETDIPSKAQALNMGDALTAVFPRFYVDADVVINIESIRKIVALLDQSSTLAAAPRPVDVFLPGTHWAVRGYYRFWTALPYIREGMIAAGVFALSQQGRERFKDFPDVIADDGYVRLLFEPQERAQLPDAVSDVCAPRSLRDLLKIRTRSRMGTLQLSARFPDLVRREMRTKNYGRAFLSILRRPALYLSAFPYAYVTLVSRLRARRQMKEIRDYVWERDDSSRQTAKPGS
jgi:hypothetical protein